MQLHTRGVQVGSYTAYQLSKDLNANFRTVTKLLKSFEDKGLIEIDGTMLKNKATVYNIPDEVLNEITTRLQACKSSNAIVRNNDSERNLSKLKELQEQLVQQDSTIKNLNESISNKDKEIQSLTNKNVQLDADLKIAQSEIKLIGTTSDLYKTENAKMTQELKEAQKKVNKLNKIVIALGSVLLVLVAVLGTFLLLRRF